MAISRKRRKRIHILQVEGRRIKGPRAIKKAVRSFFKNLYSQLDVPDISLPQNFLPRISTEEARILERRPTPEEVKDAVWSCESSKSPGYDGFNFKFIKNMWEVIGGEIVNFVLNFFECGYFPNEINMMWVVLILKIDDAVELNQYKPISMVGCLYKVI